VIKYTQHNKLDRAYVSRKIAEFLQEDIPETDITTVGTVHKSIKTKAIIQAQQSLVFAGEEIIHAFFCDNPDVEKVVVEAKDGDYVDNNSIMAEIYGSASVILQFERVLLNLLQRVCGIATKTREYAEIGNKYNVKVLDTRKTTPGLRMFEKYAVATGGGTNHRLNLSDGVLIKDNHIQAAGSITNAVHNIKNIGGNKPVEVEVETFDDIREAIEAGADGVLLDNMSPSQTKEAIHIIRNLPNGENIFIESSGGITLNTLEEYCKTGINAVSVGALTHSVKAADIHIEFEKY
jgi:nicotinate-nucleotide pyrophosphorylase (carboxylating)